MAPVRCPEPSAPLQLPGHAAGPVQAARPAPFVRPGKKLLPLPCRAILLTLLLLWAAPPVAPASAAPAELRLGYVEHFLPGVDHKDVALAVQLWARRYVETERGLGVHLSAFGSRAEIRAAPPPPHRGRSHPQRASCLAFQQEGKGLPAQSWQVDHRHAQQMAGIQRAQLIAHPAPRSRRLGAVVQQDARSAIHGRWPL